MTEVISVELDGTEFGPLGEDRVVDDGITIQAGGAGAIGTATVVLDIPSAGAYTIRLKSLARLAMLDTGSGNYTWRWFLGTVSRLQWVRTGDDLFNVRLQVDLVDCNEEFYALVYTAAGAGSGVPAIAAGTFEQQVIDWTALVQGTPTTQIDTSGVLDLARDLPAITRAEVAGRTYLDGLRIIFANARMIDPALRITATLRPDTAISPLFGPPVLDVIDAASFTAPRLKFADDGAVGYYPILPEEDYERQIEAAAIIEKRQSVQAAAGAIYTATQHDSSVAPHPYSDDGYWWGAPLKDTTSQDATAAQALVDRSVQTTAIPRETQTILVAEPVRPGEPIQVRQSSLGTDTVYAVAGVDILLHDPSRPLYRLTLGARKLRWGEEGEDDVFAAPVLRDVVPPEPPTDLGVVGNTFDEGQGQALVTFGWTPSVSGDVNHYVILITRGGATVEYWAGDDGATAYPIYINAGESIAARVAAVDDAGNVSMLDPYPPDLPITATGAAFVPPASPSGIILDTGVPGGTGYWYEAGGAAAAFTYTLPGLVPNRWRVRVRLSTGGNVVQEFDTDSATDPVEVHGLDRATAYFLDMAGLSDYGALGTWASAAFTIPAASPPAPTLTRDTTTLPPSGFGYNQADAYMQVAIAPAAYSPVPGGEIDHWELTAITPPAIGVVGSELAAVLTHRFETINRNTSYTYKARGVTPYGDVGSWGSFAYSVPNITIPAPTSLALDGTSLPPFGYAFTASGASAHIKWDAPSYTPEPGAEIFAWRISYQSGSGSGWITLPDIPAATLDQLIEGVNRGQPLTVAVAGVSRWGDVGTSGSNAFLIPSGEPPPPYDLGLDLDLYGPFGYGYEPAGVWVGIQWTNDDTGQPPGGERDHYTAQVVNSDNGAVVFWQDLIHPASTRVRVFGLARGVAYEFQIWASNAFGEEGILATFPLTIAAASPPAAYHLSYDAPGWNEAGAFAAISWSNDDTAQPDGGGRDHYRITVAAAGTDNWILELGNADPAMTGLLVTGLQRLIEYEMRITAVTLYGDLGPVAIQTFTVPNEDPAPPTSITRDTTGIPPNGYGYDAAGAYIGLGMTLPDPQYPGTHIRVYETVSGQELHNFVHPGNNPGVFIQGLTRGINYTFWFASHTLYEDESATPTTYTYTVPAASPPAPTSLHLDTVAWPLGYGWDGAGPFAYVAWTNSSATQPPGGERARYQVRVLWSGTDNAIYENLRAPVNLTSIRIPLPKRATNFDFVITPVTLYGDEGSPGTLTLNVPTEPAPAVPTLSGRKTDKGVGFSAVWTAPSSWNISGWILRWRVQGGSGKWYSQRFGKDTLEAVVDGLLRAATYEVIIVGVTEDGTTEVPSATATIVAGSISRIGPPNTPLGLYHPDSTTPGWTKDAGSSANAVYTQETGSSVVHSGEAIHKLAITSTAAGTCTVNEDVTQQVKAGYGYDYDVYVRGDVNGVGTARAKLQWINSSGSVISTSTLFGLPVLLAGSSYRSTVVAPALAVRVRWILEYTVTGTISAAYFDTPILKDSPTVPPILWDSTEPPVQAATFDAYSQAGYVLIQALNSKQWRWIGPAGEIDLLTASMILSTSTGPITLSPATQVDVNAAVVATGIVQGASIKYGGLLHGTGTSFPGSPTTGDRYIRTDLAYREFWYDGSHWLTNRAEQQLLLPGNTTTYSVSGTVPLRGQGPGNVKVKIKRVMWRGQVAATNDANSYWQLRFFRDNSGRGFQDAYDLTTAATGTAMFYLTGTADVVWDFTSLSRWGWQVNKAGATGTPGNLTLDSVVVEYYETV